MAADRVRIASEHISPVQIPPPTPSPLRLAVYSTETPNGLGVGHYV